ncbi:MAG: hypothetical protein ACFKPT_06005 [Gloeotrichia echinulata GP01]
MRTYLYILAGINSALIGWNLGQFFLTDLNLLPQLPEIILFPSIAISLAIGMVVTEIFISTPTRLKLNLRIAKRPLLIAAGLGLLAGLIAGGIYQIVLLPQNPIDERIIRTIGWLIIGGSTGLAEGVTWRWRSIEAGDPKRFEQRRDTSFMGGIIASLAAALLFEIIRQSIGELPPNFKGYEDPIGFIILGILLGFVFSKTTSPSYMVALRAGAGFEYTGLDYSSTTYPTLEQQEAQLKFVGEDEDGRIEEGMSIQLPATGKIRIGSADKAHIRIPDLALHVADIEMNPRETFLIPNPRVYDTIEINGERLSSRRRVPLKHNSVLTFYAQQRVANEQQLFRFVYYNRFLDPQS